ncbi:DNA replication/repair protein RecF [Allofustis seminis]|uniref:DNA replication/repair protein RecF n=1 Tax=Allofustis seminis TaxID=166939 RepID=UPI0003820A4B|nr:DNA replication/repair protein RecF [Allofustis seminis]
MYLEQLHLKNFRNYTHASLQFSKHVNIFIGNNAHGKTNLLESIYFLALARSHRTNKDNELILFNKKNAYISGDLFLRGQKVALEIMLSDRGKQAKSNHLERKKLSDYIGTMNVIMFAPEDLELVKGSPAIRRNFIDRELGQMDKIYLYHVSQYQQILKLRNEYLKQLRQKKAHDTLYLDILTEQLAAEGAEVLARRLVFTHQLEKWAQPILADISRQKETLAINYQSSLPSSEALLENEEENTITMALNEAFLNAYRKIQAKEIEQGTTTIGPHRDDLSFFVNGQNVQNFGSQGQQRTTSLSVKLAEIELMKEQTGEYPILLLDDVLSELDDQRQTHLLYSIQKKVQTFLTTTSIEGVHTKLLQSPKLFEIENGQILSENYLEKGQIREKR